MGFLVFLTTQSLSQAPANVAHFAEEALKEKLREGGNTTPQPSTNKRSTDNETGLGAEPFISQSKFNPDLLSIAYMDSQSNVWKISISQDGGDTWANTNFNSVTLLTSLYPTNLIRGGGDPISVFDSNGNLHVIFIHLHTTPANANNQNAFVFEMFYASSGDMGQTWVPHNSIANGSFGSLDFIDRPWIDIDLQNNIYVAGIHFTSSAIGDQGNIMWKKEATQSDFTALGVTAISASSPQFANLSVDANSVVHITASLVSGQGGTPNDQIAYVQSNAGGTSFGTQQVVGTANTFPGTTLVHDRENGAVSSAVDGNNVYIAWTNFEGSIKSYYVYSNDGGNNFSSPIEIGVDFFGPNYYALMPVVAADGGNMAISWYKVDKTTEESDYVVANSTDQGASLASVYTVSDQLTDFSTAGTDFYGDYNSATMLGNKAHLTWCDSRTGDPRVYYANIDFDQITGVADLTPINGFLQLNSLYPNPTQNELTLEVYLKEGKQVQVEILNEAGKRCFVKTYAGKEGQNTLRPPVSELTPGSYFVRITTEDNYTIARKFLKL